MGRAITAAGDDALAQAHRRLLADPAIQFDLPAYVRPPTPGWIEAAIRFFRWLAPAFPYIFWAAIALTVALIAYWIVRNRDAVRWRWRKRRAVEHPVEAWHVDAAVAAALLADAEGLAAQGRYAEAARLLLRRSVEDIGTRLPQFLKPSLTARDIASAPALPANAQPAFAAIARVVEVSAFGARSVSADAWEQCRAAYARLFAADSWRAI